MGVEFLRTMKIVVFLDVRTDELAGSIVTETKALGESVEIVQCGGSIIRTLRQRNRRQRATTDTFTCLITEEKSMEDAGVVYAIYCEGLPVLSLADTEIFSTSVSLFETLSSLCVDRSDSLLETQLRAVRAFFSFQASKSQVVVFEGGDGVGKATQTRLLIDRLRHQGYRVATLEFPSDRSRHGNLIREILSGKKGGIHELDPKLFSLLFSLNRFACLPELQYWVRRGTKIILDRYYTANCGHQASKYSVKERNWFIQHLQLMEVSWLRLPRANTVFYLDLPPKAALTAMEADPSRGPLDIHETAQSSYKEDVRQAYLWCCQQMPNWIHIDCCKCDGSRLSPNETNGLVYEKIWESLT